MTISKSKVKKAPIKTKKKEPTKKEVLTYSTALVVQEEDYKLTPKQELFVVYYVETCNATKSYIRAYRAKEEIKTNSKEYNVCKVEGSKLLSKPNIKKQIDIKMEALKNDSVASAQEILNFFTDVMRGKVKDQLGFETAVKDRLKAGTELARRYKLFEEEEQKNEETPPNININVVDNSRLEATLYNENKKGVIKDVKQK